MSLLDQVLETQQTIRNDIDEVERYHVLSPKGYCSGCVIGTFWPCRPLACATWLRRIVFGD